MAIKILTNEQQRDKEFVQQMNRRYGIEWKTWSASEQWECFIDFCKKWKATNDSKIKTNVNTNLTYRT